MKGTRRWPTFVTSDIVVLASASVDRTQIHRISVLSRILKHHNWTVVDVPLCKFSLL